MKKFVALMMLSLILQTYIVFAASATKYPEFEADTKIEIIGEPRPGEPFEVVFTFAPLEDLLHNRGVPDKAYLTSERGVRFLGGDTVWSGFMQMGKEHILRATYIVDTGFTFKFRGIVYAMEVPSKILLPDPVKDSIKQVGVKCVNGTVSYLVDLRTDEQKRQRYFVPVIMVTDSGIVPMGSSTLPSPKDIKVVNPEIEIVNENKLTKKKGKSRTWEEALQQMHRLGELPIKLDTSVPDTIRISYDSGRVYVFVTDSSITSVNLELLSGKGAYEKIDDKKGTFQLVSDSAVFKISAGLLDKVLVLKSLQFYFIDGESSYKHVSGNDYPVKRSTVKLFYWDNNVGWVWDYENVTDDWGQFTFSSNHDTVLVAVYSINYLTDVLYSADHYFSADDTLFYYYVDWVTILNTGHVDVQIPDTFLYFDNLAESGAFHILNCFIEAQDYIIYEIGESQLPPMNVTIWDDQDDSRETSSYGGFLWNGVPGFYIASRANYLVNWDEWDRSVLHHEYGHYVMDFYMEEIPQVGGQSYYLFPIVGGINLGLALSEGWANFFSAAMSNDPTFINSTVSDPLWFERNFEWPIPDPPYYNSPSEIDPLQPPRIVPQYEGAHIVGAVTVALWDLFDNPDDDDYYVFSYNMGTQQRP